MKPILYDKGPLTLARWLLYRAYKFHSPLDNDLGVEGPPTQKQKEKNSVFSHFLVFSKMTHLLPPPEQKSNRTFYPT